MEQNLTSLAPCYPRAILIFTKRSKPGIFILVIHILVSLQLVNVVCKRVHLVAAAEAIE